MPSKRVSKEYNSGVYFVTLTVKNWYYLFDRHNRWEVLESSLKHCQDQKGLKVYAYVFMLNHIHLLVESDDMSGFLRDFKKHTARELYKNLKETEPKAAELFEEGKSYSIWEKTNLPQIIVTEEFFVQKRNYIENNPVEKNYVLIPEHWLYSSANPDSPIEIESPE